jgi:hypothetical protein
MRRKRDSGVEANQYAADAQAVLSMHHESAPYVQELTELMCTGKQHSDGHGAAGNNSRLHRSAIGRLAAR